jgi:hypothetical protein
MMPPRCVLCKSVKHHLLKIVAKRGENFVEELWCWLCLRNHYED